MLFYYNIWYPIILYTISYVYNIRSISVFILFDNLISLSLLLLVFLGAMLKMNECIQWGSIIIILSHNLAVVLMKYLCTWR